MKKVRDIVKLYSDMGLSIRKIQGAVKRGVRLGSFS